MERTLHATPAGSLAGLIAGEIAADRPVHLAIAIYSLAAVALVAATGNGHLLSFAQYFPTWPLVFGLLMPALLVAARLWLAVVRRAIGRGEAAGPDFPAPALARLAAGVVAMLSFGLFMGAFTSIKNALPVWRGGFPHDSVQADIDRMLHLGVEPAAALGPALPRWIAALAEANYSQVWFIVVYGALFLVMATCRDARFRLRYAFVFMAAWVLLGNLLAFAFLSAGPVFYSLVADDAARFGPLDAFLAGGSIATTGLYRDYLWQAYEAGRAGLGTGISAFPSVHVGATFMLVPFAFEANRRLGLAASAYALVILASSVALGWHYAIDGYAAIAVVAALWRASRRAAPAD